MAGAKHQEIRVEAFTDGAAKGNPGPGGWGAVLWIDGAAVRELGAAGGDTTNNRMEMMAAAAALEWIAAAGGGAHVTVRTDSTYVMKGATEWMAGWKKKGWKTRDGGDVANRDLWERLAAAQAAAGKVTWRHVPGHAGVPGNERADEIASGFAAARAVVLYAGPYEGYGLDLAALPAEAARPRSASRAGAAWSYLSLVDGVVARHATWAECERRVKGRAGARFRKTASDADEKALLAEWGVTLAP